MRKITDFVIEKRYYILTLFVILTGICAYLSSQVTINYDISKYLPSSSETRKGMDIMEEDFPNAKTSSFNLMFEDLKEEDKTEVKEYLESIEGVKEVDYDNTSSYNKDNYTLYSITVEEDADSPLASSIYEQVKEKYKENTIYTSGEIAERNEPVLPFSIIVLAVVCALIILIIMCPSYVEPFLFLAAVLMAVVLNNGTNIFFDSVSNITSSICAILQLALSMDYSIMLMNRYEQEKEKEKDSVRAMKNALHHAFQSISSSSITTVAGLLALVFMSFTIGRDLGLVLAKGVLFSLICIFFVLPTLILLFEPWIRKTKKKTFVITLNHLGKFSYHARHVAPFVFLLVFVGCFLLKGNLGFDYTNHEEDEISHVFAENNQMAVVYPKDQEEKMAGHLTEIEEMEKVDEVLGYGNTIHEKLPYNQLNQKLNDLGSDTQVEDYLLRILYYNYYNPENPYRMTFEEFVHFIEQDAYQNEDLSDEIDSKTKENITRLKNFTTSLMNEKKTAKEISQILEIEESKTKDLFIYYLSIHNSLKLGVDEFVSFLEKDVLTNPKYASEIDQNTIALLKELSNFTDSSTIEKKLTFEQMAELFGMEKDSLQKLYQYYLSLHAPEEVNLTIEEFSSFVLNEVLTNNDYASLFTSEDVQKILLLNTFSNKKAIQKEYSIPALKDWFGLDSSTVSQVLFLKYRNLESSSKWSIPEIIHLSLELKQNTNYLDDVDLSDFEMLSFFSENENNRNTVKMTKEELSLVFSQDLVDNIYRLASLPDTTEFSPQEFVNFVLEIVSLEENPPLSEEMIYKLQMIKLTIDSSLKEDKTVYTASELANLFGNDTEEMKALYALVDLSLGKTDNWTATPYEFVTLLLENHDLESIQKALNEKTIAQLELLYHVMDSSINGVRYSYSSLGEMLGLNQETAKNLYTLYAINHVEVSLSPYEFVTFLLSKREDEVLKNSLSQEMINKLTVLEKVMQSTISNTKYQSGEISSLLGIDKSKTSLLYGLYASLYQNPNLTISMREFVSFLLNEVVKNPEYASNFDEEKISKLHTVNEIMNSVIHSVKYSSDEMFAILGLLADDIDKDTIEVLFLYDASKKGYDENWTMTIEEFVDYLNQDILTDARFTNFISEERRNEIIDAKDMIQEARDLLMGKSHSRIVINTKYDPEGKETFQFIQEVKDTLGKDMTDFYVIGDSPMAYDMSGTFNDELNMITVITMIVIFLVVALTFKSLLIPIILVLTIQCAVYLTMGILSFTGGNVYFIAILIVQSILMGATIDYAILYTSYYLEHRKKMGVKEAITASYNQSIHTILTSALILIIVTLIVGHFSSAIASKICKTISEGTMCSSILILVLLPAVIASCDKWIVKKK